MNPLIRLRGGDGLRGGAVCATVNEASALRCGKIADSASVAVGMGTALAVTPDLPQHWMRGEDVERRLRPVTWSDKTLASATGMALVRDQAHRIARGVEPSLRTRPLVALIRDNLDHKRALRRYRSWIEAVG